jgi:hypothetical protein
MFYCLNNTIVVNNAQIQAHESYLLRAQILAHEIVKCDKYVKIERLLYNHMFVNL